MHLKCVKQRAIKIKFFVPFSMHFPSNRILFIPHRSLLKTLHYTNTCIIKYTYRLLKVNCHGFTCTVWNKKEAAFSQFIFPQCQTFYSFRARVRGFVLRGRGFGRWGWAFRWFRAAIRPARAVAGCRSTWRFATRVLLFDPGVFVTVLNRHCVDIASRRQRRLALVFIPV